MIFTGTQTQRPPLNLFMYHFIARRDRVQFTLRVFGLKSPVP